MLSGMNGRNGVPGASKYTVCVHVFQQHGLRMAIVSSKNLDKLFVCTNTYGPTPQVIAELEHVEAQQQILSDCMWVLSGLEGFEKTAVVHSADSQSAAICQAPPDDFIRFAGS